VEEEFKGLHVQKESTRDNLTPRPLKTLTHGIVSPIERSKNKNLLSQAGIV